MSETNINLYFANNDTLKEVIEKYKEQIMKDTLANNIFYKGGIYYAKIK